MAESKKYVDNFKMPDKTIVYVKDTESRDSIDTEREERQAQDHTLQSNIDTLSAKVDSNHNETLDMLADEDTLIKNAQTDIKTNTSNIAKNANNITTNSNDITKLDQVIEENKADTDKQIADFKAEAETNIVNTASTTTSNWLTQHVTPTGSAVTIDTTLSISGSASDSKTVGDSIVNYKTIHIKNTDTYTGFDTLLKTNQCYVINKEPLATYLQADYVEQYADISFYEDYVFIIPTSPAYPSGLVYGSQHYCFFDIYGRFGKIAVMIYYPNKIFRIYPAYGNNNLSMSISTAVTSTSKNIDFENLYTNQQYLIWKNKLSEYITDGHIIDNTGKLSTYNFIYLTPVSNYISSNDRMQAQRFGDNDSYPVQYMIYSGTGDTLRGYWNISNKVIIVNDLVSKSDETSINEMGGLSAFKTVGVVGDSLSVGYMTNTSTGTRTARALWYGWPHFLGRKYGNTFHSLGFSGSTCKSWFSNSLGYDMAKSEGTKSQCYIVGIGTNDNLTAGTGTYTKGLGTIDDINTSDYTQNADSFYGYYGRIIQALLEISSDSIIFCMTIPNPRVDNQKNNAIKEIVDLFSNCILVDLAGTYNSYYTDSEVTNFYYQGHFTAMGYQKVAQITDTIITDVMNKNYSKIQDIGFINETY